MSPSAADRHAVPDSARPRGAVLMRFVVVADTHVNEDDTHCTSPYETNRLANVRARHVFQEIAAMDPQPALVMHLGDIVHPVPSLPAFDDAVAIFKEIVAPVTAPVHVLPGNHDVGDKRIDWMPADQVCDAYLASYRAAFGDDFYAFDRGPIRFVAINSLLLNSGLADEARQRAWLTEQIADAGAQRVFLFMHYPPYILSRDEPGNYDNIDEPARSWLLDVAADVRVEAIFAGHVHNFWYDRLGDAELYMLPSTAFVRHDFSEFYRVAPAVEFGRGDPDKFGYFIIDVHESGHVAYSIRTMGARAARGERGTVQPARLLSHPKLSTFEGVGVELRHTWTETMQIAATGGVQEFGRKWARNDYPTLALMEMGVRLAKVPDTDLTDATAERRMALLARLGTRYLVTCLGRPRPALLERDLGTAGVTGLELNMTLERFEATRTELAELRAAHGVALFFSKILTYDDSHFDGQTYSHFVKAGFTPAELDRHHALLAQAVAAGQIDGVTVRLEMTESVIETAPAVAHFADTVGCRVLMSLKLAGPSLAQARTDDRATAVRTAQAMVLSRIFPRLAFVFDTFMDVDRGYYPRHAFINRRFAPRAPARVFSILAALFKSDAAFHGHRIEERSIEFSVADARWELVTANSASAAARAMGLGERVIHDLLADRQAPASTLGAALAGEPPDTIQALLIPPGR